MEPCSLSYSRLSDGDWRAIFDREDVDKDAVYRCWIGNFTDLFSCVYSP